ncbi:DNA-entry nuclease [Enterococcus faecalis]|uniref:DNA/RNA non-specific endonuclease n=1 Tax=Enterococcus faecalis TaxID=1351 RepID=UPI000878279B|nr:DNA/RNA non-specific endonuclease [Enterococcus faecalis]EKZ0433754.1 DNA/RNA non-specific endonuclease [Enterococcus faecalis]OFA13262.1 DNA-entry nuclease [Enterococcus faecalis]
MRKLKRSIFIVFALFGIVGTGCEAIDVQKDSLSEIKQVFTKRDEKQLQNSQVEIVNQNKPNFSEEDFSLENGNWQIFSELDRLNRVGVASALLHKSRMPTEERERLYIKPTGWKQKKMKNGDYLYNRCHLIGYQLTGENNNPRNLMTGTRSFNTTGMVEYENKVADYLRKTGNHVLYRVTPDFRGNELVARGVRIEAQSIEDNQLSFHVYVHNVQEGYTINYLTGESSVN